MNAIPRLAGAVGDSIRGLPAPVGAKRPSTGLLYGELKKRLRPVVGELFGGPVFCRYSGCPEARGKGCSTRPGKAFRVLEYLWDFSLSRYCIPQAIGDPYAAPMGGGLFELLLVAESELGTSSEVCRDLLKLLDARTRVRCLIYREPKRSADREKLHARMLRTMNNHAHFRQIPGVWLFAGLTWSSQGVQCTVRTVNQELDALVEVRGGLTKS